jgi:hypothetical protein
MDRNIVTLYQTDRSPHADELRSQLAEALGGGTVGAPDEAGMLEIEMTTASREEALRRVRDALAAVGGDDHFVFTEQTGTGFRPAEERARSDPDAESSESGVPTDETRRPTWLEDVPEPPRRDPVDVDVDVPTPPNDLPGPEKEPRHLERGSPREEGSEPYEPPPRDVP